MTTETKIVITAATAQAQAALRSFESSFKSMIGVVGGAVSVGAFSNLIKSSIDLQDELGSLSAKTGISAKGLAGLKFAADQNGASLDVVARAAKELAVNISASPEKFAKLGINAKDATGALAQMADLVSTMPDGMQKTALLAELMGKKVGPEMAEFLSIGGASMREYIAKGQDIYKVTDQSAASAKKFKDQMKELEARTSGFGIAVSNLLLPGLNDTAKAMNDLANEGHPVLALWRALAGMGKVPWDLLSPPENLKKELSADGMIKDLQVQIGQLERNKASGSSKLMQMIFGTPQEIDAQIAMYRQQIETIKKHAAELDKPAAAGKPKQVSKDIQNLLSGDKEGNGDLKGLQVLMALERDYQDELAKRAEVMQSPLLSASEKALAEDMRTISKRAQDARVDLEKLYVTGTLGADQYSQRLQQVAADEDKQKEVITALRAQQDQLNASWQYGAKTALTDYLDEVNNVAKQSAQLFANAFKGMEDALVSFVRTGKLDFKSLADSIINDMIRMSIRQSITGPLAGMMMRGLGGGIPGVSPSDAAGLQMSFDGGGYTGTGARSGGLDGKGGFMAILHPQETVVDHAKGQTLSGGGMAVTYAPVIQIDSRTDQSEVHRLVSNAVKQGNAELVDILTRNGRL